MSARNKNIFRIVMLLAPLFVVSGMLSFLLSHWLRPQHTTPDIRRCADCNVVFVSFDTLRADHVHALGYPRQTTPTIDALINKGFVFRNAITVAPWTLPSTMSWFTGVYPSKHKVLNKYTLDAQGKEEISNLKKLSSQLATLAEVLKNQGYKTGGFTGGAGVDHQFGFDQGFETYTDDLNFGGFKDSFPKALEWIKKHREEKLFVFLHGYDIHGQYVPEGGYDKRFVDFDYKGHLTGSKEEQKSLREEGLNQGKIALTKEDTRFLIALYDEKIQRADQEFSQFLQVYSGLGLLDKTIFIITSDHGDEFYEHGRIDHGHSLYEEQLRVPLIIVVPGNDKRTIDKQVRSIDIMPTIFELLAINLPETVREQMEGTSLVFFMEGKGEGLDAFSETDYRYAVSLRSLRTPDHWKLIRNLEANTKEAYNLLRDPQEATNLFQVSINEQVRLLEQKLREHLGESTIYPSKLLNNEK